MRAKKAITFKTAAIIVIGLHVAAVGAIISGSSYKANIAKKEREVKRRELEAFVSNQNSWPTNNQKAKTVAKSTEAIPLKEPSKPKPVVVTRQNSTKPKQQIISPTFQRDVEKFINEQINSVTSSFKSNTVQPKIVYSKTVSVDFDVPFDPPKRITKNDVYNAMPSSLKPYSSKTRTTSEQYSRVVRTYPVIQ